MRRQVLVTELLKLRRSVVPWVTLAAILFAPLGIALFMWIAQDPERAASLGLLGAKANLAGFEATWPAYGGYLALIVGAGGMLLIAFIVAFLFGREYAEGTARNLLALPVDRAWFVSGKLSVAGLWWAVLVLAALVEGFLLGLALGLPGLTADVFWHAVGTALICAAASFLLAPVIAWVTIWSRSDTAAVGFALGALLVGNLLGHTGWGPWFPWSIVPLLTGISGAATAVPWTSYLVLGLTFVGGVVGSVHRIRHADNP